MGAGEEVAVFELCFATAFGTAMPSSSCSSITLTRALQSRPSLHLYSNASSTRLTFHHLSFSFSANSTHKLIFQSDLPQLSSNSAPQTPCTEAFAMPKAFNKAASKSWMDSLITSQATYKPTKSKDERKAARATKAVAKVRSAASEAQSKAARAEPNYY